MKKAAVICLFLISSFLYSQFTPGRTPDFKVFINSFIETDLRYKSVSNYVIEALTGSKEMYLLYTNAIESFTQTELINIFADPTKLFEYTTNESAILLGGVSMAVLEAVKAQNDINPILLNKFKKRIAFSSSSGNNYGIIIPLRFPLASFGIGFYMDLPKEDKNYSSENNYYDYAILEKAIDYVSLPYLQLTGQVNLWTLPISIGFRAGWLFGFKGLYKQFVSDADIESFGFNVGGNIKALIWRNDYFFIDMRTDFNYNSGKFSVSLMKYLYVPVRIGYLGGTDTGVIFESNPGFKSSWQSFSISPRLTFGFKFKDRVPIINYFGISFSIAYDSSFVKAYGATFISSSKAYANIKGYTKTITGIKFSDIKESSSSYYGDIRLSLDIDFFYMSFSFEYGVFSKMYSILFTPFLIRF